MPWSLVSAAIIGGATIGSSLIGANAAKKAAQIQADATAVSNEELAREFDLTREDTAPYRGAGKISVRELMLRLGLEAPQRPLDDAQQVPQTGPVGDLTRKFSVADFWNDPVVQLGYQSGLDLGTKALKARAPLTTGMDSGAALKELTQFGVDYTGRTMGEGSYGRFTNDQGNVFNKLAALAGIGQTAVGQTTSAGVPISQSIAGNTANLGNAQGASTIAGANAWGGGLQSVANWWQSQNTLNRLFPQATPSSNFDMVPGQYSLVNRQYGG